VIWFLRIWIMQKNKTQNFLRLSNFLIKEEDFAERIKRAQEMIDNGTSTLLTGIPYGIKDNILNQGHIASAGSHMLGKLYCEL
jgi:Asp-tRNA(Asn)/Glu-tRNA(Gln) amidotransferase A subunit family amidase